LGRTKPHRPALQQAPVIDKPGFGSAGKKTVDWVEKECSWPCALFA
jgi:hypothetical protein